MDYAFWFLFLFVRLHLNRLFCNLLNDTVCWNISVTNINKQNVLYRFCFTDFFCKRPLKILLESTIQKSWIRKISTNPKSADIIYAIKNICKVYFFLRNPISAPIKKYNSGTEARFLRMKEYCNKCLRCRLNW